MTPTAQDNEMQPKISSYYNTAVERPESMIKAIIKKCLAIHSPNITMRLSKGNTALALLPPMDEVRVRQWLREIYPHDFRAYYTVEVAQDPSLELEEIRAVFSALLDGHIQIEWFKTARCSCQLCPSVWLLCYATSATDLCWTTMTRIRGLILTPRPATA